MRAVDGYIAEARFGATNLDVLAFAFVAFQRHTGQAANGIRYIGIRQAGNDFGWQHLHDIGGGAFTIERLDLAALAFSANDYPLTHALDLEHNLQAGHLSRIEGHFLRKRRESEIQDRERVLSERNVGNREPTPVVRH